MLLGTELFRRTDAAAVLGVGETRRLVFRLDGAGGGATEILGFEGGDPGELLLFNIRRKLRSPCSVKDEPGLEIGEKLLLAGEGGGTGPKNPWLFALK